MESEEVRLIIWGAFGCFGFIVFLIILRLISRLDKGKNTSNSKPRLESLNSLRRKMHPMALLTERSAAVVPTILRDLSLTKLEKATDSFNAQNLIKIGKSGDFFAGILDENERVVVKRTSSVSCEQLQTEMEIHSVEWSHRWVVSLVGQCSEQDQKLMVYKFVCNGDLATALAKGRGIVGGKTSEVQSSQNLSLPWITRLKIATETAEALYHFHFHCHPPILHKDIKSSSILLTKEYEVRLGSLSYAQRVENASLLGYDIFCFGKVLLDLISGLDISGSEDPYANEWVIKALPYIDSGDRDGLLALIDPSLVVEEDFTREILGVVALARGCLDPNSLNSVTMKTVFQALRNPQHLVP